MNYFEFAIIVREKRIKLKLTQDEMSFLLNMSRSKYNRIENGIQEPSFTELVCLCIMLEIDITKEIKKENEAKNVPHYD